MAITAAAVATTAATVASAGVGIAQKAGAFGGGGGGGGGSAYVRPGQRELIFNRGTTDIMDAERGILGDAITQGKLLEPEMYKALGLEPVYDQPENPDLAGLSGKLSGYQDQANAARERISTAKAGKPYPGRKRDIRLAKKEELFANRQATLTSRELEQKGAVGRRVVGFKPLPGVADPTGSAGGAFGAALDQFSLHLSDALAGKEPLDPTLKSSFDDRERTLRERLRRQMGPDYETSTAGIQALANFDRERSEAYAQYNRQSIEGYSSLAESRAGALASLTSERLKNLAFPPAFRAQLGQTLEGAAAARQKTSQQMQAERGVQIQAAETGNNRRAQGGGADIPGALSSGLSGIAAGGNTILGKLTADENARKEQEFQRTQEYNRTTGQPYPSYGGLLG